MQRVPVEWPLVHLEAEPPAWSGFTVAGMVRHPGTFTLTDLAVLGLETRSIPIHCVWGWSRPTTTWTGVALEAVLDLAEPTGEFVTVTSASDTYSSCLPLADARRGFLATERDGRSLPADEGGPLRFVGPEDRWAYKGVKWAAGLTVSDRFTPGFWESKVEDPHGVIPEEVQLP